MTREALYWRTEGADAVRCELCPTGCRLRRGRVAPCGSRANVDGAMLPTQYGRVVSAGVDPMEKKPLYHFLPGAPILSIAASGCNLHCQYCQNWNISQCETGRAETRTPEQVLALARQHNSCGVAYTYSEPLVWYEFVRDTAERMHAANLKNVIVSNGFCNEAPLRELLTLIDAANIDLKSMDERFYRRVCKARLEPVLTAIRLCHELGVHLEVTNLVIPGQNDSDEQIQRLVDFLADLDESIPLHLSAYRPAYKFTAPPTSPETLQRAAELARRKLLYVFVGNVLLDGESDTVCPHCRSRVIERSGYRTVNRLTAEGACPDCGHRLPVVLE
ncbi:MAG: AmmeMemoRadiSam system radical SAM enzyme [bacterium]